MSDIQNHILLHCKKHTYDRSKPVDENINVFNMRCVVGMIETGEAAFADLDAVGGKDLVAAVAKAMDSYLQPEDR